MNFSTNQVMQFYVVDSSAFEVINYLDGSVALKFKTGKLDENGNEEYRVSDKIENVIWGKYSDKGVDAIPYMVTDVTLNPDVNGGAPVVGETYVVRVKYPEVAGLGVEGWTTKTAAVTVTSKTNTAETLFAALGEALKTAISKDGVLEVTYNATSLAITAADVTKNYRLGTHPVVMPTFEVSTSEVVLDGEYVQPFKVETAKADPSVKTPVPNGYKLAEMEYFALGERGDQYRDMAWPDKIKSDYKIVPTKAYSVLVLHYAYKGANEGDYKSEKDLIIVSESGSIAVALSQKFPGKITRVALAEEGGKKEIAM